MKIINIKKIFLSLAILLILTPALVKAQTNFEDWSGLKNTGGENAAGYENSDKDIPGAIGVIIRYVLSLVGVVFIIIILIGYMKISGAGGNEEEVTKGKMWIKNGAWGVLIVLAAYFLTNLAIMAVRGNIYSP